MLSWWQTENMIRHLVEALYHINYAKKVYTYKKTLFCRCLFDALNKTWTAFNAFQNIPERSDNESLLNLFLEGVPDIYVEEFLKSQELQQFVEFEPHIMNHDTFRRNGYLPNIEIKPNLIRKATKNHRKLVNAYENFKKSPSDDTKEKLLKKAAQLLYIVRSNIAHGEKTPYGPDLKKSERDEKVSGVVKPNLLKLLELIFDKPDEKLVVYGTLAPGASNRNILEEIKGIWQECKIKGEISSYAGLKYFRWEPARGEIDAKIFISKYLPDKLSNMDEFEGSMYHRILIPVKIEDYFVIANVYEDTNSDICR